MPNLNTQLILIFTKDCQIYNSACGLDNFNEHHVGRLGCITLKHLFERVYIHFEGLHNSSLIQTMIVCVPSESFTKEIEVVNRESIPKMSLT